MLSITGCTALYCMIWASIFITYGVEKLAAIAGIDKDFIGLAWRVEKWAFLATIASYVVKQVVVRTVFVSLRKEA